MTGRGAGGPLGLIDLAARRLGGMVLEASDEFFAAKENLLEPADPVFDAGRYSDRGQEMDGWETRRQRGRPPDWCLVRLGVPGVIASVVVDTAFFRGNYPEACELEGTVSEDGPPRPDATWFPVLGRTALQGDTLQRFPVAEPWRVTHVRFTIVPDGGVARLRLLGVPLVDVHRAADLGGRMDLAASVNGGRAVACSDAFYSSPQNLIMVGDGRDMSDGWETRRRRGPGDDWAVIRLAAEGLVERVELDTTNFKGNFPDRCTVEGWRAAGALHGPAPAEKAAESASSGGRLDTEPLAEEGWVALVGDQPMQPHARHVFDALPAGPVTHVRLRAIPDGGVARMRVFGAVTEDGWRQAGLRLLNALRPHAAEEALLACCGSTAWAAAVTRRRPFVDLEALFAAADEVWAGLQAEDRLEAFAAHPRIGDRAAGGRAAAEQAGAASDDAATLAALEDGNRRYEERFGHVFLIRAAGRSAAEMLAALEERLGHDPATERTVATAQQAEITRLRLDAFLREGPGPQRRQGGGA